MIRSGNLSPYQGAIMTKLHVHSSRAQVGRECFFGGDLYRIDKVNAATSFSDKGEPTGYEVDVSPVSRLLDVRLTLTGQPGMIHAYENKTGVMVARVARRADGVYLVHVFADFDKVHGHDKPASGIPCESIQAARQYIDRTINGVDLEKRLTGKSIVETMER